MCDLFQCDYIMCEVELVQDEHLRLKVNRFVFFLENYILFTRQGPYSLAGIA